MMVHYISGLVAQLDTLASLGDPLGKQQHFALDAGFGFCPLDDENLHELVGPDADDVVSEFLYLTPKLVDLMRSASSAGPLVYVETQYRGGDGGQGAVVFRDQEVVFGPLFAEWGAINSALAMLGVSNKSDCFDAFETVGLKRHRGNDSYRKQEEST